LADEARALIAATAEVAGDKVAQARQRLSAAIHQAEQTCENIGAGALARAKEADHTVRQHPYSAMGVAFGVGALIGFLLTRRNRE
jgi:ElaB/YqjD/DUF883 family membrane-anchored ribosome-binding protein